MLRGVGGGEGEEGRGREKEEEGKRVKGSDKMGWKEEREDVYLAIKKRSDVGKGSRYREGGGGEEEGDTKG